MRALRPALMFVALAGVAAGVLSYSIATGSERINGASSNAILFLSAGWSFIAAGLFAWWRRPHNRVGVLLTSVGFAWFLSELTLSDDPWVFIVGAMLSNLAVVVLAHLVMSFPTGRLEDRTSRILVGLGYLDGVALAAVSLLFLERPTAGMACDGCPENPIALTHQPSIFEVLNAVSAVGGVLILGTMVALTVRRWRGLPTAARPAITPVLFTGGVTLSLLGASIALSLAATGGSSSEVLDTVTIASVTLVPFAFLFGLLRVRFHGASAVAELVEALTDSSGPSPDIREALAEALGDPSLEFAYWFPESESFVDAAGRPVMLPNVGDERASESVEHDGELVAAIVFDATIEGRDELVRSAALAAGLVLRNQQLEAKLRARLEELRASRFRLVRASDEARRRVERDLHDGAQQHLVSMAANLRLVRSQLEVDPKLAGELIDQTAAELATATEELRELARGIHPAVLMDRGLKAALDSLASRAPLPVEIEFEPTDPLSEMVESAIYFVVAEALTNVARYAEATHASIGVTLDGGVVRVVVADDGRGGADVQAGSGISGLSDRVAALDGTLDVVSPPRGGTVVTAEIPCVS